MNFWNNGTNAISDDLSRNSKKVIVALSGGIDSAAALWLLLQNGYEPIGVTFQMWRLKEDITQRQTIDRARRLCELLKVPHLIVDIRTEFEREIVRYFAEEYLEGLTPNPCVLCNRRIKWRNLLKLADENDVRQIATGHYARINFNTASGRYQILKGCDKLKDQSYALWQISQTALRRTLFPLGELTKDVVKQIVAEHDLIIGEVEESQDVCFIPDDDYRKFLMEYIPAKVTATGRGELVDENGKFLRWHDGFYNFTIGQRKGFGIGFKERRYVKSIDASANRVVIAADESLFSAKMIIRDVNWVSQSVQDEFDGIVKVRYNHRGAGGHGHRIDKNIYEIEFTEPQRAICPGQSAVVYQGDCLLMGGIIHQSG